MMEKDRKASWSYAEVWDKFPVPARPTQNELKLIERKLRERLKQDSNVNVLILGSTIEYRSLCKKLGITPTVADFSKENFEAISNYSKEKFHHENFVQTDWLQIKEENEYDVILGHRAVNVIHHTQIGELFRRMHSALKQGGVFFCKGNVRFPGDEDILEKLRNKWAFAKRDYPLFTYLEVELYFKCSDKEGYLSYPKARGIINDWKEKGLISEKDYAEIKPLLSMGDDARFNSTTEAVIEPLMSEAGFSAVQWIFLDKEFAKNMPIIRFVK